MAHRMLIFFIVAYLGCSVQYLWSSGFAEQDKTKPVANEKDAILQFQEVVQVDSAKKDQLYNAALTWFGQTFRSGKEVLQIQDREGGSLVGRASFEYVPVVFMARNCIVGFVDYTITFEFKDGRYRYTIGPFSHEGNTANRGGSISFGILTNATRCPYAVKGVTRSGREATWADLKKKASIEAQNIISSFKSKISSTVAKKDDW